MEPDNPQWKLLETVWKMAGPNGYSLSEPFWKLPSRRIYPDYYKEIKNPLSLYQIRNKLTKRAYGTVSEVAGDLTIMFENAKKYNVSNSKLYKVNICPKFFWKVLINLPSRTLSSYKRRCRLKCKNYLLLTR